MYAWDIDRPKGYVEPPSSAASKAKLGLAQMFAASLNSGPTSVVLLENMVALSTIREENERLDVGFRTIHIPIKLLLISFNSLLSFNQDTSQTSSVTMMQVMVHIHLAEPL